METKNKKEKKASQKPVKTFRDGAIGINVWQRQSQTGFQYYEYSISRSYKSQSSGKEGYSSNFFPRNEEAIINMVREASAWIAAQMESPEVATQEAA